MPADVLDTIANLINSPPGQLVAGAALAGIVWKFFERVEAVLTDSTKKDIAQWLRVRNFESGILTDEALNWPNTFAEVFDRVFGKKHLSLNCFLRSVLASFVLGIALVVFVIPHMKSTL